MRFAKDLGYYSFSSVRKLVQIYCKKLTAEELPLGRDVSFKWLFLIACRHIDKNPIWCICTKLMCKKLALLLLSKISRDTAYVPTAKAILEDVIENKKI